jgi:small GTP-binding protein
MANDESVQKKIILLGDGAVGKTSLIRRFVVDKYDDKYILTIGTKITAKSMQIGYDNKIYDLNLQIWDILGQKGFTKLHSSSFKGTDGVILVADITRKDTLISLARYWIPKVQNLVGDVPLLILANKSDLVDDAEFNEEIVKSFASLFNASYYFTSAKIGENVHQAFYDIGRKILETRDRRTKRPQKVKIIHPSLLLEGEKGEIVKLLDKLIDDFCKEYGDLEDAMPVLREQFEKAGVDLRNPSKSKLKKAIQRLAHIEMNLLSMDEAEANAIRRIKWINETKFM